MLTVIKLSFIFIVRGRP